MTLHVYSCLFSYLTTVPVLWSSALSLTLEKVVTHSRISFDRAPEEDVLVAELPRKMSQKGRGAE